MEHDEGPRDLDHQASVDEADSDGNLVSKGGTAATNEGRRRILKGALATAPVIMTVASRPAWALNCTHSGQMSGNMSGAADGEECGGEGCSPGYWKTHPEMWCHSFPPEMQFNDVFGPVFGACGAPTSLYNIINDECQPYEFGPCIITGCPPDSNNKNLTINYQGAIMQLAFHSVAALQNACTAVSFDMTVEEVIATFQNAYNGGNCNKDSVTLAKDGLDYLNNLGSDFCAGGFATPCGGGGTGKMK